jgi:hypothetical protein
MVVGLSIIYLIYMRIMNKKRKDNMMEETDLRYEHAFYRDAIPREPDKDTCDFVYPDGEPCAESREWHMHRE